MSRTVRRRRSDDPAERPVVLLIGAAAVAAALGLLYVAFTSTQGIPGVPHYNVTIQSRDFGNLTAQGADVRIAGKRVGQTRNVRFQNGLPTADLQLDADVGPLPADTTARLRPRGLLGPQFVDLVPGTAADTLPDGALIGARRTSASVQLQDMLDTFDAQTRRSTSELLRGLGGGLAGRGEQLNAATEEAPALLTDITRALRPLVERPGVTRRFVTGLDAFGAALEPIRVELAEGFADAEAGLRPLVDERASLARTLVVAPVALPEIRGGPGPHGPDARRPDALRPLGDALHRGRAPGAGRADRDAP